MIQPTAVPSYTHRTVLLQEAIDALNIEGGRTHGVYIDGTFGRGGHSRAILKRLNTQGHLIAFDKDLEAISAAHTISDTRFEIIHDSFSNLDAALHTRHISHIDGILLDLGISSPQIDDATRGFSFRYDGPLDMRMDTSRGISAAEWIATAPEENIKTIIRDYGEERFAPQIAKAIVTQRNIHPITQTRALANLIDQVVKTREPGKDKATRTFQAIRIHINQELTDLTQALEKAFSYLAPEGRLVVISFHSLEDRIVKKFMADKAHVIQPDRRLPIQAKDLPQPQLLLISKIKPTKEEITHNPRARSAILRVAQRLPCLQQGGL
jgi:16S rRNA (cytosine1402-N4)-methyltransferase